MKNRKLLVILSALVCIISALCVCANAATYSGTCGISGSNLTWSLDTDTGVLEIDGEGTMKNYSSSSSNRAPWYSYRSSIESVILGDSVTSIGNYAFYDCDSLASVTIGVSVTSIGNDAFDDCDSLTRVTIPDSVTSIGNYAFRGCSSLESITIPDSVTSIGNYAFSGCSSLESVIIPDSVTSIGYYAFSGCSSLTSITIPDSVTSIGYDTFYNCSSLESVTIGDSVTSIGSEAFWGCSSLTDVYYNGDIAGWLGIEFANYGSTPMYYADNLYFDGELVTEVVIPDSVTSIGSYAFYCCSSLESVTIPDSVASIGYYAFRGCYSLTSVIIPDSVTSIGNYAFSGCSSLTSVTIGDSVTSIGDRAFEDCYSLTSVTIPDSVTSIGSSAFLYCSSLTDVYYNGDVAGWLNIEFYDYDSNPMYYADNLYFDGELATEVVIPDSVTSIGSSAFYGCSSLESVTIPDSVTRIGKDAFGSSVVVCEFLGDAPTLSSNALHSSTVIYYSEGASGFTTPEWKGYACYPNTVPTDYSTLDSENRNAQGILFILHEGTMTAVVGDKSSSENNSGFNGKGGRTVVIPETVTKNGVTYKVNGIGQSAFYGNRVIDSVTIPASVLSIGINAFFECANIKNYTVLPGEINAFSTDENGVLYNGSTLLYYPSACELTSFTVPQTVKRIQENAFYGANNLDTITIGFIGESATSENSEFAFIFGTVPQNLKNVILTDRVTSIGDDAFEDCDSLENITIPDSVTSIGNYAFDYCSSLTSIEIPDSITYIGRKAFNGCSNLEAVYVSDLAAWCEIEFYDYYANPMYYAEDFYVDGEVVASLEIPNGVESIGKYAFYNCSGFTSVSIPKSVESIGSYAFYGCDNIEEFYVDGENTSFSTDDTGILYNKNKTSLVQYPAGRIWPYCNIPDSVTKIMSNSFYNCLNLLSILIPENSTVQSKAIEQCNNATLYVYEGSSGENYASNNNLYYSYCNDAVLTAIYVYSEPVLTTFSIGQKIDFDGLYIGAVYSSEGGTLVTECIDYELEYDKDKVGVQTVNVVSGDLSTSFEITIEGATYGNVDDDGKVTIRDAALILQFIAGWDVEVDDTYADVDGNGVVNIRDAALILQFIAGWDVTFG